MSGRKTAETGPPGPSSPRLEQWNEWLKRRHAGVEPDPGFAGRVGARLVLDRPWPLAWAAMRLLPFSVVLVLALLAVALASPKAGGKGSVLTVAQSSVVDDPLAWVWETGEESR